jgi:hypothetical protein
MTNRAIKIAVVVLVAMVAAGGVLAVRASPLALDIDRYVIGGGGGHSEAGSFVLDGTVGQAIAGTVNSYPYDLCAGFWCGMGGYKVYLPLVLRGS